MQFAKVSFAKFFNDFTLRAQFSISPRHFCASYVKDRRRRRQLLAARGYRSLAALVDMAQCNSPLTVLGKK